MNLKDVVETAMQAELRAGGGAVDAKVAADMAIEALVSDPAVERMYMQLPDPESPSWLRRWVSEFAPVAEKIEVNPVLEVRHERTHSLSRCA